MVYAAESLYSEVYGRVHCYVEVKVGVPAVGHRVVVRTCVSRACSRTSTLHEEDLSVIYVRHTE